MNRILSLLLALSLIAGSCTKPTDDLQALTTQKACQNVSAAIHVADYSRIVTLVIDLDCVAVGHLDVEVAAGATVAAGCYTGPCKAGAVRLGIIRRK